MEFAIIYMTFALLQAARRKVRSALWFAVGVAVCFVHYGLLGLNYEAIHCVVDHFHTCSVDSAHEATLGDLAILKHTALFLLAFVWGWALQSMQSQKMAYMVYAMSLHQFAMMLDSYNAPMGGTMLYEMYSPSIFMFNILIIIAGLSENSDDRGIIDACSRISGKDSAHNGGATK